VEEQVDALVDKISESKEFKEKSGKFASELAQRILK